MDPSSVSAIADTIAAIGVIVTLLYLASQIRAQTKESRLTATRDLARDHRNIVDSIFENHETFALYLKAINDYEGLAHEEKIRAYVIFTKLLRIIELQYLHMRHANVDPIYFKNVEARIRQMADFPGMQMWWKNNRKDYSDEFRAYLEGFLSQTQ